MNGSILKVVLLLLIAAGVASAFWFFRDEIMPTDAEPAVQPAAPADDGPAKPGPIYPLAPMSPSGSSGAELIPLPPLDDSDAYFLLALTDLFGLHVRNVLVDEALIDKFVATVDNLSRAHVAEKIRPVDRLPGAFVADAANGNGRFILSRENFQRYEPLVGLVAAADLDALAETYRRFYPLFQESYTRLGYPDAYFNDRVVEVIDHLLATPEPQEPIRLVRPHVLYEFADPQLEALSSGQKLLLRMGNENAATIKRALRDLRVLITLPQT